MASRPVSSFILLKLFVNVFDLKDVRHPDAYVPFTFIKTELSKQVRKKTKNQKQMA